MDTPPTTVYRTYFYDSTRWHGFVLRPNDLVLSTPPKCGTTWLQRICALLIFQKADLEKPLTSYSPWIDMLTKPKEQVHAALDAQRHRRFIKTHTPADGLPWNRRTTYVCIARDPRDVALSWLGHLENANLENILAARAAAVGSASMEEAFGAAPPVPETERDRFWQWIEIDEKETEYASSLRTTLHHVRSFWDRRHEPNVVLLHYADLKADLEGGMRALARRLGLEVAEDKWPALVKAATFEEMKKKAGELAPSVTENIWQDPARFFRSGGSGEWRAHFGEGDEARYQARARALAGNEEMLAWIHHGAAA